jgi:Tripartite tricarboxylate transporter family receptor
MSWRALLRATLGQPILIENVVGAGGTIVMGNWGTHVALGATYQLDFDLLDFAPIAQLPGQPGMIATRKTLPASNLRELIAWLKSNQDKVSVGNSGVSCTSQPSRRRWCGGPRCRMEGRCRPSPHGSWAFLSNVLSQARKRHLHSDRSDRR